VACDVDGVVVPLLHRDRNVGLCAEALLVQVHVDGERPHGLTVHHEVVLAVRLCCGLVCIVRLTLTKLQHLLDLVRVFQHAERD
jgi:hypothetical protein